MNWIQLPSGDFLNLDAIAYAEIDGPELRLFTATFPVTPAELPFATLRGDDADAAKARLRKIATEVWP